MRNFRFLLASALLMLSLGAWAAEKHADLSIATATGNATWTPATNTFAWSQNSYAYMAMTDIAGDLREWTSLVIESDSYTSSWRVDFIFTDNSQWQGTSSNGAAFYSTGKKTLVLADKLTATQLSSVKEIRINQNSEQNSIVIKDVYLKNDTATTFTRTCSGFTTLSSASNNCYYNTATKNFSWTGSSSNNLQIFEMPAGTLSDYITLTLTTSDLTAEGSGYKYRVLFMAGETKVKETSFASAGTKTITLSNEMSTAEIATITSIRFAGYTTTGNLTILPSSIYLTPEQMNLTSPISGFEWYNYSTDEVYGHTATQLDKKLGSEVAAGNTVYGPYSGNGKTAYMDVTNYDKIEFVTANSGTAGLRFLYGDSEIWTQNTSATQTYTSDISSITKVGSVKTKNAGGSAVQISSINFTKAFESAFSANAWAFAHDVENTAVQYNRAFTAGRTCTIWLPFDLTAEEAAAAGTFYELIDFVGDELRFDIVTEPKAYTPYILEPIAALPFASLTGKTVKALATPNTSVADGAAVFKGTLQHMDGLSEAGKTLYGYSAAAGEFVKAASDATIDAFRAYIAVPGSPASAPARFRVSINKTPTAIEDVQKDNVQSTKILRDGQLIIIRNGVEYTVNGQRIR